MYTAITIIGLFFGIWFTSINGVKLLKEKNIPAGNFLYMAVGWTMFISGMWILP